MKFSLDTSLQRGYYAVLIQTAEALNTKLTELNSRKFPIENVTLDLNDGYKVSFETGDKKLANSIETAMKTAASVGQLLTSYQCEQISGRTIHQNDGEIRPPVTNEEIAARIKSCVSTTIDREIGTGYTARLKSQARNSLSRIK
ncbi:MAG: hypothetical protein WAV41_05840 [Microgenomates group bacterium]